MNYKLITSGGGGIFSVFMDVVLINIFNLESNKFYIEVRNHQYNPPDCFNYVFNQEYDNEYIEIRCRNKKTGGFSKKGKGMGAVEDFPDLELIKQCCKKFDIRKDILDAVMNIPDDCLGVHFRGKDMNYKHPEHGIFTYADYERKIDEINPTSIFVASDNYETIEKIKRCYAIPVYYYDTFIREQAEEQSTYDVQINNLNDITFWQEAFIDMLTLSKCDSLLCRASNFANAAIVFSDTLNKIYRL